MSIVASGKELPRMASTILLADDEPFNLQWVMEYLESKGYTTEVVDHVDAAISRLQAKRYRAVIADLSIPVRDHTKVPAPRDALAERYPGLIIAEYARNRGHLDRQVIVYSVHDDALVQTVARTIGYTYMLKGRPRQVKSELDAVLAFDPLNPKRE